MRYRVTNTTRNTLLGDRVALADGFFTRLKGLMGVTRLPVGEGLHIVPCTSIHTFFMRIPIDVLFLDRELNVVDLRSAMPAWRMSRYYPSARSVLELPAGTAEAAQTRPGDRLAFVPADEHALTPSAPPA